MKSLLHQLTHALNKVDGNVMLSEDRGYDEYFCTICKGRVYEESYNHKHKCCFKCFYKEDEI
jgi:hypothetical protein